MADIPFRTQRDLLNCLDELEWAEPRKHCRQIIAGWKRSDQIPHTLKVTLIAFGFFERFVASYLLVNLIRLMSNATASQKAAVTVLSYLTTDIQAISALCRLGFDVQARNLMRSVRERVDLLICVSLDEELAEDFIDNGTFEGSKSFFFARISKGKLKRRAATLIKERVNLDIQEEWWGEWRSELELMLGAAEHPNHTVGLIALFPNIGRKSKAIGIGGWPSNNSNRTLTDTMIILFDVAMLASMLKPELDLPSDKEGSTLNEEVKADFQRENRFVWNAVNRLLIDGHSNRRRKSRGDAGVRENKVST